MAALGVGLLVLSLFMLMGFLRSDANVGAPATIAALLITVALPAAGGVALLTRRFRRSARLTTRKELLRQQTLEAEVLRLAAGTPRATDRRGGRHRVRAPA